MRPTVHPAPGVRTAILICARLLLLVGVVFAVDRAFAGGVVYRCGNQYQDQPCAAAVNEAARPATTQAAQPSPPRDASKRVAVAAARPAAAIAIDRQVVDGATGVTIQARR